MKYNLQIRTITYDEYPIALKQIPAIPKTMEISGELPGEEYKYLCVVGSRQYDQYGRDVCNTLISGLKGYPIVIVSGLAHGIDSIAHRAALNAGLKTVAFPGSGLAMSALYPHAHRRLATEIAEYGGVVISPFSRNQSAADWTFPSRNRLMAGISHGTLIIEAAKGSGTLLTAGYALEFGRDVMAVPGSIDSKLSYGPHMLIRDGAALIRKSEDILAAIGFSVENIGKLPWKDVSELKLSADEKKVVAILQFSPQTSDDLMEQLGMHPRVFNTMMSRLEMENIVSEYLGRYKLNNLVTNFDN